MNIRIPNEELYELITADGAVKTNVNTGRRHGHTDTWVVPKNGKFYQFHVWVHTADGWLLIGDSIEAVEVIPVKKMVEVIEWKPAPSEPKQ